MELNLGRVIESVHNDLLATYPKCLTVAIARAKVRPAEPRDDWRTANARLDESIERVRVKVRQQAGRSNKIIWLLLLRALRHPHAPDRYRWLTASVIAEYATDVWGSSVGDGLRMPTGSEVSRVAGLLAHCDVLRALNDVKRRIAVGGGLEVDQAGWPSELLTPLQRADYDLFASRIDARTNPSLGVAGALVSEPIGTAEVVDLGTMCLIRESLQPIYEHPWETIKGSTDRATYPVVCLPEQFTMSKFMRIAPRVSENLAPYTARNSLECYC